MKRRDVERMEKRVGRLVGKRIASIQLRAFDNGRGGTSFDPILRFEDGSFLSFTVDETDSGDAYGITPIVGKRLASVQLGQFEDGSSVTLPVDDGEEEPRT